MKTTNAQAFAYYTALKTATNETGKLGYAIAKNARKIEAELKEYMQARDAAVQKYGTDAGNGTFRFTAPQAAQFQQEMSELDGIECEIDIMTVNEDTFCGGNLTSEQMYSMDWMVAE